MQTDYFMEDNSVIRISQPLEPIELSKWLRRPDLFPQARIYDEVSRSSNFNLGNVASIVNIGGGPAIGTHIVWLIDVAKDRHGENVVVPFHEETEVKEWTWPAVIRSAEVATIEALPPSVAEDTSLSLESIRGRLLMRCADISGKQHEFVQRFHLSLYYDPWLPGFADNGDDASHIARASFHFNELDHLDGPFPHKSPQPYRVAKPAPSSE